MRAAITGGSGSLGRALLRRLTTTGAERVVVFSRDEQRRAELLADFGWHPGVRVFAGDVRDVDRLADIFEGCEEVIHAAARKVVTAQPDEAYEMLLTNITGTLNVLRAALRVGVRKVLLISSDKAVAAANCYGVSKAMAEQLVVANNAVSYPRGMRSSVVRYGNVLGSRGSVLVLWRRLAAEGKPLPLSDPAMTRFWVTLPQAVEYVLAALAEMRGGEIFVPSLPAAPLTRLAEAVVETPAYVVTGIRPGGEKLHEELLSATEARRTLTRNQFFVIPPYQHEWMWDARPWLGAAVPADFSYRSDTWPRQATVSELRALLEAEP